MNSLLSRGLVSFSLLGVLAATSTTAAGAEELLAPPPPVDSGITFNLTAGAGTTDAPIVKGDACSTNDATQLNSGAGGLEVANVIKTFDFQGGATADRSTCLIRVGYKIPAGKYLQSIHIGAIYDAIKSTNPEVDFSFSVGIVGKEPATISGKLFSGAPANISGAYADDVAPINTACGGETTGNLMINVGFSAVKVTPGESVHFDLKSLRLRGGSELIVKDCQ